MSSDDLIKSVSASIERAASAMLGWLAHPQSDSYPGDGETCFADMIADLLLCAMALGYESSYILDRAMSYTEDEFQAIPAIRMDINTDNLAQLFDTLVMGHIVP